LGNEINYNIYSFREGSDHFITGQIKVYVFYSFNGNTTSRNGNDVMP